MEVIETLKDLFQEIRKDEEEIMVWTCFPIINEGDVIGQVHFLNASKKANRSDENKF